MINLLKIGSGYDGTCDGFCGGASDGGCYCDSVCDNYGDCCDDKVDFCGDESGSGDNMMPTTYTIYSSSFPPSSHIGSLPDIFKFLGGLSQMSNPETSHMSFLNDF